MFNALLALSLCCFNVFIHVSSLFALCIFRHDDAALFQFVVSAVEKSTGTQTTLWKLMVVH